MSSIMQILRRIGGAKATPTSGSAGQLALWKAGTAPTDAASLYAHDGTQWVELLDTSRNPRVIAANDAVAGLRITQTGTGDALLVEDEANPDATPFIVDTAGKVGIGGRSTAYPFAVIGGQDAFYAGAVSTASYAGFGDHGNPTGATASLLYDRAAGLLKVIGGPRDTPAIHATIATGTGHIGSMPTRDNPLAGSNVVVDAAGNFGRASSSAKYKKDIENLDATITDNAIRSLRPVWYRSKKAMGDDKPTWSHIGLIAEEVAKVEPRLVNFKTVEVSQVAKPLLNDDGTPVLDGEGKPRTMPEQVVTPLETPEPEDVDYARLSVLLLDYVQRLEKRVAALEARP